MDVIPGKFSSYKDQVLELGRLHFAEVGMPGTIDLEVDLDLELYKTMEELNQHLGIGIFDDEKLIGYLSVFIYNHHQHKSTRFAQTDGFFVNPKKRGLKTFKAICQAFKLAEAILKEKYGVEYFILGTNAQNDLKFLAESLEFTPSAVMYLKRL